MYKNHRIVFDLPNSYIENKNTGKRTEIIWKDSSPNLIGDVLESLEEDGQVELVLQLNPLETRDQGNHSESSTASPGFHRLATKP